MSAATARTKILAAFDTRLWALYNSSTGTTEKLFRKHRVGPLVPWNVRPAYSIVDGGQRKGGVGDNASEGRILALRLALHVCDTWEKAATHQDWSDRVEGIIAALMGRPAGYGILSIDYLRDDPIDVVFLSGAMQGDWIIDFEVGYFLEVDAFEDWQ